MTDTTTLAGCLLVGGPVLGLIPVAHPALMPIWSMPQESFVATVGAHRLAWTWLNGGFALATIATTAGMWALALSMPSALGAAATQCCAVVYGIGGVLWCAVLSMRSRTVPLLADRARDGQIMRDTTMLDSATGGLFQAFVLITGGAVAALGLTLLLAGAMASMVSIVVLLMGIATIAWLMGTGDVIPAVLYLPTLLVGLGLLIGW
jgi:hypothetical protein